MQTSISRETIRLPIEALVAWIQTIPGGCGAAVFSQGSGLSPENSLASLKSLSAETQGMHLHLGDYYPHNSQANLTQLPQHSLEAA